MGVLLRMSQISLLTYSLPELNGLANRCWTFVGNWVRFYFMEVSAKTSKKPAGPAPRGPWISRVFIWFLTGAFGLLAFVLEGFILRDIESMPQPNWQTYQSQQMDVSLGELQERSGQLDLDLKDLARQITRQQEEQRVLQDGSRNLQETLGQLVALQRLAIQKELAMSQEDQSNLSSALNQFLQTQTRYQEFNRQLQDQIEKKGLAEDEKRQLDTQAAEALKPIRESYDREVSRFRMRLALLQLMVLVPLLLGSAYCILRRPKGRYEPLFLAFGLATLFKCYLVVDRYFPARYVNYVLIILLLGVVGKLLAYCLGMMISPARKWLIRQYREAYERFLCPVCEYPIRTGPRKYLYWTRRTVHKTIPPQTESAGTENQDDYCCPSCGTTLFEACSECGKNRHSLLPHCSHCGQEDASVAASSHASC